jgi:pyruvate dehydrogenase (quinone)
MAATVADSLLERLRAWDVQHIFAYAGDGINGILGPGREQASVHPGPAQGDGRLRGRRIREVHRPHGHGHLGPGSHPRARGRDRRPEQPQRHGRLLPEVDLLSLFKDAASEYVQMVTVPEQLPNVLDRAIRTALAERAPTALIIPADVQELEYSAPSQEFKIVPSSLGTDWPVVSPDNEAILRAAEVLNSGGKVAILAGQGARHPAHPAARHLRAGQGRGHGAAQG